MKRGEGTLAQVVKGVTLWLTGLGGSQTRCEGDVDGAA